MTCPALFVADVMLTRSDTWLGKTIRFAERRPGDPSWANHVGIVTQSGIVTDGSTPFPGGRALPQAQMVEALWHVRRGPVWDFYGPPAGDRRPEVAIYRPYALPSNVRSVVAATAESAVGERYGWWVLFGHLGDSVLSAAVPFVRDVRLFRRLKLTNRKICSRLVAFAFSAAGLDFGVPAASASPDDIHDWITWHPKHYRLVYAGTIG